MSALFSYIESALFMHHDLDVHPNADDFSMHAHDVHEMFCFLAGEGHYYVEGNNYPLTPGSILLLRAGEAHCLHISPRLPYERLAIHFSPALLDGLDPSRLLERPFLARPLGQYNLYPPEAQRRDLIQAYLQPLLAARNDAEPAGGRRVLVLTTLCSVLLELLRSFDQLEDHAAAAPNDMSQIIAYINGHLSDDLSMEALTRRFFVSKTCLTRHFRHVTGSSIKNYVITKRLLSARQSIRDGAPASQAAAACGWSDYSSFYRHYRAAFGASPRQDGSAPGRP